MTVESFWVMATNIMAPKLMALNFISLASLPSVCSCAFLHDSWMDFLHIRYHDQVPSAADACVIEIDTVPNLSYYGNFIHNF